MHQGWKVDPEGDLTGGGIRENRRSLSILERK
jgi:hypothetical protein